jgi:amidohydrolase
MAGIISGATLRAIGASRTVVCFASYVALASGAMTASADAATVDRSRVDVLTTNVEPKVIAWRRDLHEHPELSNRETRTAKLVADQLKSLGLEVQTGVAHTGVVGFLKGGHPGPTVAIRADMDALPVTEKTDVPFKSHATATYRGETVGVMHACGHDSHTAMLMGIAQVLTGVRDSLPGNILFIFQPAEEGAPSGEEGGAGLMLKEGLFDKYKPQVIFGMHVWAGYRVGDIAYRSGPVMAAVDSFNIVVKGRQAHGSRPWQSIDPIVTSAQIIGALQTVVSRNIDLTEAPAVVSIGAVKGGIRYNIIPDQVEMLGTLRSFTPEQRAEILTHMTRIIENTAAANGATAKLTVEPGSAPVLFNDPALTRRILPSLQKVVGPGHVKESGLITASEDYSWFAQKIPSVYFFVGITPADQDPKQAPSNHSDYFYLDERGIPVAMHAMTQVVLDYLESGGGGSGAGGSGADQ